MGLAVKKGQVKRYWPQLLKRQLIMNKYSKNPHGNPRISKEPSRLTMSFRVFVCAPTWRIATVVRAWVT